MSFKRVMHPLEYATGEKLTSDLVGIGVRLAASPPKEEPPAPTTARPGARPRFSSWRIGIPTGIRRFRPKGTESRGSECR